MDKELETQISEEIFSYFMSGGGESILIPDLEVKLPYDREDFYDVLQKLIDAKYFEQARLGIRRGRNFTKWAKEMIPPQVAPQQINIGSIAGPAHVGGQGDIIINMSDPNAAALIELIRELTKKEPSPSVLSKVKEVLTSGKAAVDIIKILVGFGKDI